jgi:hypothetical protein
MLDTQDLKLIALTVVFVVAVILTEQDTVKIAAYTGGWVALMLVTRLVRTRPQTDWDGYSELSDLDDWADWT